MQQLIGYVLVGSANNFGIYCVYLLITYLGIEPKAAMTLMYIIGASIGFLAHRKWTFAHGGNVTGTFLWYVGAHISGYILNLLLLYAFVDRLGYPHQWVQAVAIGVVAVFLFVSFKYLVFRHLEAGVT